MSGLKSILKNTAYLITSEQLSRIFSLIQVVLLVRYLGKTNYGVWSLTQSLPGMFLVLTDIGINTVMLRRIASRKDDQEKCLEQVLLLKVVLTVLFIGVVYGFVRLSKYDPEVQFLIYLSGSGYALFSFCEVIVVVYRALEKFYFESIVNAARNATFLLCAFVVVFLDLKLIGLIYAHILVNGIYVMVSLAWYIKQYSLRVKTFEVKEYVNIIKESLPFAVLATVNPLYFQIDIIMLSQLSTYEAIGVYNAAYRIILFLMVVPVMVRRTVFSRLAAEYATSIEVFKDSFVSVCRLNTMLAVPISVGIFVLSDKIILLFFSSVYMDSAVVLRILSISIFFYYLRAVFEAALYAGRLEYQAGFLYAMGTALNIALDYVLIRKYSFTGAAYAALFAEVAIFLGYYLVICSRLFKLSYLKTGMKIVISSLLMGLVVRMADQFSILVQILIGIVTYGFLLYIFRVFNHEEYNLLRGLGLRGKRILERGLR